MFQHITLDDVFEAYLDQREQSAGVDDFPMASESSGVLPLEEHEPDDIDLEIIELAKGAESELI